MGIHSVPFRRAVITGGASGIGRELARRFKSEGAAGIVVADVQEEALVAVAEEVGGLPLLPRLVPRVELRPDLDLELVLRDRVAELGELVLRDVERVLHLLVVLSLLADRLELRVHLW